MLVHGLEQALNMEVLLVVEILHLALGAAARRDAGPPAQVLLGNEARAQQQRVALLICRRHGRRAALAALRHGRRERVRRGHVARRGALQRLDGRHGPRCRGGRGGGHGRGELNVALVERRERRRHARVVRRGEVAGAAAAGQRAADARDRRADDGRGHGGRRRGAAQRAVRRRWWLQAEGPSWGSSDAAFSAPHRCCRAQRPQGAARSQSAQARQPSRALTERTPATARRFPFRGRGFLFLAARHARARAQRRAAARGERRGGGHFGS